jgi:DNA primase
MRLDETIRSIKERVNIASLIGETVRLKRKQSVFVGCCPFHKEKTPSFHVNAERGRFHCFGCHADGDAIDFLQRAHGLKFDEALKELAARAGLELQDNRTEQEKREATAAKQQREDLYRVSQLAALFFVRSLRGKDAHPLARYAVDELAKRGLDATLSTGLVAETLQAFHVGYAPSSWDGLAVYLRAQGVSLASAERVGLIVPRQSGDGYYDRFRHRLMFAVTDIHGRIVGFSGRALPSPTGEDPAKYVNSPESEIYTKGEHLFGLYQGRNIVRQSEEAIVVEGNFDVVSLHARGICNAVAPLGTAFTEAQAKLVKRYAPTATLAFDPDNAGTKAARAAREPCAAANLLVRVMRLPAGEDPDALIRRVGADGFLAAAKRATSLREWLINEALSPAAFAGASLEEQRARVADVAKILRDESDPTLRALTKHYADLVAAQVVIHGQPLADLRALERSLSVRVVDVATPTPVTVEPLPERLAWAIVDALLDWPEVFYEVEDALDGLEGDAVCVVGAIRRAVELPPAMFAETVLEAAPVSRGDAIRARLALPLLESASDALAAVKRHVEALRGIRARAQVAEASGKVSASIGTDTEALALTQAIQAARLGLVSKRF